jgi:hypothetical protein
VSASVTHIAPQAFAGIAQREEPQGPFPIYEDGRFVASFATLRALCQYEAAGQMAHMLRNIEALLSLQADPRSRELARRIGALLESCSGRLA